MTVRVLVIAAHPDDEVYGVGGTIARLADDGHEVYTLIVTDGSSTQYPGDVERARRKILECERANAILGVRKVFYGNLPDMRLDTVAHVDVNAVIVETVLAVRPDWVFTHHRGDVNKDHEAAFDATMVACRPVPGQCVKRVYSYEVASSTEWTAPRADNAFLPNVYIDVTASIDKKALAAEAYETELREFPHPRSIQALRTYAQYRGVSVGVPYAEAFMLVREVM